MNLKQLVSHIAAKEGLKKQVSVGNIREIVGIVSDLLWDDYKCLTTYDLLLGNGRRRSKKKGRK